MTAKSVVDGREAYGDERYDAWRHSDPKEEAETPTQPPEPVKPANKMAADQIGAYNQGLSDGKCIIEEAMAGRIITAVFQWQLMDAMPAPRDGATVLLYNPDKQLVGLCKWVKFRPDGTEKGQWETIADAVEFEDPKWWAKFDDPEE